MEATLVIVTLLSLAIAIGMAIVTWRLLQEERQRTEARVAALEEGLAASLAANPPAAVAMASPSGASGLTTKSATPSARVLAAPGERERRDVDAVRTSEVAGLSTHAAPAEIVELHGIDEPDWLAQFPASGTKAANANGWHGTNGTNGTTHNGSIAHANGTSAEPIRISGNGGAVDSFAADRLFVRGDAITQTSARSRGVLAMSVGAGVMVLLIIALWSVGRLIAPGADLRSANAVAAAGARSGATVAAGAAAGAGVGVSVTGAPLELVALEQTRDGDALTIHGVVRNPPAAGGAVDRLAAVVSFFDGAGQQLTTVRAPLDFRTLAPGDESPFQVTTTVPAGVIRYRVSFRRDEGTIVPHVDRRQQEAS